MSTDASLNQVLVLQSTQSRQFLSTCIPQDRQSTWHEKTESSAETSVKLKNFYENRIS